MDNGINVNLSSGSSTGNSTSNPQSGAQATNLIGQPQTLQTSNSSASINNQPAGVAIPLQPTELKTSAVHPVTKTTHHVSTAGIVIVSALVIFAVILCIYIYISNKRTIKYF